MHEPPTYLPPYDSPIEDIFAYHAVKYLDPSITFAPQDSVQTICGMFRLDFVAYTSTGASIAFECDGLDYHEEGRDEWRDSLILGDAKVDAIYRLPGKAIFHCIDDLLYVVSQFNPELFSERGRINLETLSSLEARNHRPCAYNDCAFIIYSEGPVSNFIVERRRRQTMDKHTWGIYHLALETGARSLDELRAAWEKRHYPSTSSAGTE
jgi:hypothetical protein